MATTAQVIANRANAQHSTGPQTAAGKQASAANSITTGLTASKLFIRPDEQLEFNQLHSGLLTELKPTGITQNLLFDRIIHAAWNLRRCDALEFRIHEDAHAQNLDDAILSENSELATKLDRLYRYKKMHESSHRRAMADLRQLQTEEVWRRENKELAGESVLVNTAQVTARLGHINAVDQRANLDVLRQHIESCIAPPPISPSKRHAAAA